MTKNKTESEELLEDKIRILTSERDFMKDRIENLKRDLFDIQQNKRIIRNFDIKNHIELLEKEIEFKLIGDDRNFEDGIARGIEILSAQIVPN